MKFEIPGRAVPKGRPRVMGNRGVTPQRTRIWEETVAWHARANRVSPPLGAPLRIEIAMYVGTPLRGDLDNYAKAILDGLVKGELIRDDSADVVQELLIWFAAGDAYDERVVVRIEPLSSEEAA